MKTIKNSKEITTLEVGDMVIFGDLKYQVCGLYNQSYYLHTAGGINDSIFTKLNIDKSVFLQTLGINANLSGLFPEVKSLEALTALVSALFKEYEKQQKNELPKTWEEFCVKNKIKEGESYICLESQITELCRCERNSIADRNVCTSKQEAEAFLVLMQLRQLRKAYVKDWEPDYKQPYYGIISSVYGLDIISYRLINRSMSFPTKELATKFLTNFKDLLEIAKPLL